MEKRFFNLSRERIVGKICIECHANLFFIVFKMSKWGITRIDRFRRSFLWKGSDPENVKGGHCLVN
jgi:hypothetical protein